MRLRPLLASSLTFCLMGCLAADADKVGLEEEDALVDGAYDSFRSPIDHGELAFGTPALSELTAAEGFHAWTFSLTGDASVAIRTEAATPRGRQVDTVLYLYREGSSGWGRNIASNDDTMGSLFSGISRNLSAGRYRIIVKGYVRSTRGRFGVVAECTGAGCSAPPAVGACLFGDRFGVLAESARLRSFSNRHTDAATISGVYAAQLISAMNASGHPEVTTVAAALALATDHFAERTEIYDGPGGRAFTAWRFVLGDHWWGAIFRAGTTIAVTSIVDDVFAGCTVGFEVCALGSRFRVFAEGDSLEVVSDAEITSVAGMSAARQAQLLRAVQEAYEEATTPAGAIASVDGEVVNELVRRDVATGRTFVAYEYGAGDNSYGAAFEGESATPAAVFHDGDTYACVAMSPAPPLSTAGQDCDRARLCDEELTCVGIAEDDGEIGRCAPLGTVDGDGSACTEASPCGAGLVCSGITRGEEGICRPEWMRGTFTGGSGNSPISEEDGAVDSALVYGLATVDTDVDVSARITHARSTDLRITLTNPSGTEQVVFDGASEPLIASPFDLHRSVGGSGDESVTGHWTLRVTDTRAGVTGTLNSWSLTVTTRWD